MIQNNSVVYSFFLRSVNNDFHLIDKQPAQIVLLSTNMVRGSGTQGGDPFYKSTIWTRCTRRGSLRRLKHGQKIWLLDAEKNSERL